MIMQLQRGHWYVVMFTGTYLLLSGLYYVHIRNIEFVIYTAVLWAVFMVMVYTIRYTQFPLWMLWLLSLWGVLHVFGGSLPAPDGVLFSYRMYPFLDAGGELYVLKYDQVIHFTFYALVAVLAYHTLRVPLKVQQQTFLVPLAAVLISLGVGSINEVVEFSITTVFAHNGVGGYENTMLDLIFNWAGAMVASVGYAWYEKRVTQ